MIVCAPDKGDRETVRAYLPNPGRLRELLLPGRTVYLSKNPPGRSMDYTAVAVERDGRPILLHTHLANTIVGRLIEEGRLPGFAGARVLKSEATFGRSRFDFLLEREGRPFILEVKSCTLFGRRIAMFPDAVTERGRRHLEELAHLAEKGAACGVVFLVHSPRMRYFLPDYHTDLEFARTFLRLRDKLLIKAVAVEWRKDLTLGCRLRDLDIPWRLLEKEAQDKGAYLIVLHLPEDSEIAVGSLGTRMFPKGFYLYAGSARRNLGKRMERHLRKRKRFHWHIDYLRDAADRAVALPIRSGRSGAGLEHDLAAALQRLADWTVPGFGASDCRCRTHLFGMAQDPLTSAAFIDLLLHFRINRLERLLPDEAKT